MPVSLSSSQLFTTCMCPQLFTAVHYIRVSPRSSQLFTTCLCPPALHSSSLHACVLQLFAAVHYMPVSPNSSQLFTTCLCPPSSSRLFTACLCTPALHGCSLHAFVAQHFTAVHYMPVSPSSSHLFTRRLCPPGPNQVTCILSPLLYRKGIGAQQQTQGDL